MAIYSAKHAKELKPSSVCLQDSSQLAKTGVKIIAILKGETKKRVFHISSLLADGGKQEIEELIASLEADSKLPAITDTRTAPRNPTIPHNR